MSLAEGILVAWYGDDFTGSAATMEVLAFAGLPSVLFLDLPTPEMLARFPGVRGLGIASTARSHGPDWMDIHLPKAFRFLKETGAPVVHYKVCSTLDSAPEVGSIGAAIDIGLPIVGSDFVPCLVAAPPIRRYQSFGHLFAAGPGGVFRLDRHPVMARHPVTPMDEADVARHLSRQTDRRFGLLSIEDLEGDAKAGLVRELDAGAEVISLDTVTEGQLARAGELIWSSDGARFVVGSQGVEYALVAHWRSTGDLADCDVTEGAGPVERMVVVSGSVSPVTAAQIDWAEAHGFACIALEAAAVALGEADAEEHAFRAAMEAIARGADPLIHSARGPNDPAVDRMRQAVSAAGVEFEVANRRIGAALGRLLARLLRETGIRRAVISGGDTSGHASRQLDIFAFTALAPTIPAAALLEAHSTDPDLQGLQLALKGGQMGSADFFGWIKRGGGVAR